MTAQEGAPVRLVALESEEMRTLRVALTYWQRALGDSPLGFTASGYAEQDRIARLQQRLG